MDFLDSLSFPDNCVFGNTGVKLETTCKYSILFYILCHEILTVSSLLLLFFSLQSFSPFVKVEGGLFCEVSGEKLLEIRFYSAISTQKPEQEI